MEVQLEKQKLLLIMIIPCILYVEDVILSLLDMPQINAFTYILNRQSHAINPVRALESTLGFHIILLLHSLPVLEFYIHAFDVGLCSASMLVENASHATHWWQLALASGMWVQVAVG